jgi:hypothetical protein
MSEEDFAAKISSEAPWWSKAPIWLAAGIVGVPSLMAIGAGYFIAQNVNRRLNVLEQYNLSEMNMLNEQNNDQEHHWSVVEKYMVEDLRAQYTTCINAAKNAAERSQCIDPAVRVSRLGIKKMATK